MGDPPRQGPAHACQCATLTHARGAGILIGEIRQEASVGGRAFGEERLHRVVGAQSEEAAMNRRGPRSAFRWLGVSRPMTSSHVEVATFGVV
jgi:hypothetical protein